MEELEEYGFTHPVQFPVFGLSATGTPGAPKYGLVASQPVTGHGLAQFLDDFAAGRLTPTPKSAPLPSDLTLYPGQVGSVLGHSFCLLCHLFSPGVTVGEKYPLNPQLTLVALLDLSSTLLSLECYQTCWARS
jgi:hypothetical protein